MRREDNRLKTLEPLPFEKNLSPTSDVEVAMKNKFNPKHLGVTSEKGARTIGQVPGNITR
jgi:hypothetical protein